MNYGLRRVRCFSQRATVRLSALLFAASIALSTGCKLEITNTIGGSVVSRSGTYKCGSRCAIDITDITFDEEFLAQAKPEYVFVKWADGGLCANKRAPCKIDSSLAQLHPVFMELLLSDEVFHLQAIFDKPKMLTAAVMPTRRTVNAGETAYAKLHLWTSWRKVYMGTTASRRCPENTTCYIEVSPENQPGCGGGAVCGGGTHTRDITIRTTEDTPKGIHAICIDFDHAFSPIIAEPIQRYGSCLRVNVI